MRTIKAKTLILAVVLWLGYLTANAQNIGAFVPVTSHWIISEKTKIGAKSRIRALDQNPYPFCFSYAAVALFDQQRCILQNQNCETFTRSSALAISAAGQDLPANQINVNEGGIGSRSLQYLLNTGYVADSVCNYNIYDHKSPDYQLNLSNQLGAALSLKLLKDSWQKYEAYTPYLEKFYRTQFISAVKKISNNFTDEQILELLKQPGTDTELWGTLLLSSACFDTTKISDNYTINTKLVYTNQDRRTAYEIIETLLEKNRVVFSGVCNGNIVADKCDGALHAVVIVAKATAYSTLTSDRRSVFWIVNTWGESWQEKTTDGWIFAESFTERIVGELIWLETK